jgi:hypothetical protein
MTAIDLVNFAFLKGETHMDLWKTFRQNVSEEALKTIAETEFEEIISEIT